MARIPKTLIEQERELLANLLQASAAKPVKRKLLLRKVSETVQRSWVSAGCFGEAVQWRLKEKKKRKPKPKPKPEEGE